MRRSCFLNRIWPCKSEQVVPYIYIQCSQWTHHAKTTCGLKNKLSLRWITVSRNAMSPNPILLLSAMDKLNNSASTISFTQELLGRLEVFLDRMQRRRARTSKLQLANLGRRDFEHQKRCSANLGKLDFYQLWQPATCDLTRDLISPMNSSTYFNLITAVLFPENSNRWTSLIGDGSKVKTSFYHVWKNNHPLTNYFRVPRVPGFWPTTNSFLCRRQGSFPTCSMSTGSGSMFGIRTCATSVTTGGWTDVAAVPLWTVWHRSFWRSCCCGVLCSP